MWYGKCLDCRKIYITQSYDEVMEGTIFKIFLDHFKIGPF